MKRLMWFLIGVSIPFLFSIPFAKANTECQQALEVCQQSCSERGGLQYFVCYGPDIARDEKVKCRCLAW